MLTPRTSKAILAMLMVAMVGTSANARVLTVPAAVELLVGFDASTPHALRDAGHVAAGATLVQRLDAIAVDRVRVAAPDAVARYGTLPGVTFVERNRAGALAAAITTPNDVKPSDAWRIARANVLQAWKLWPGTYYTAATKPRTPVKVAIVDSWVDTEHPDFRNRGGTTASAAGGGQLDLANARAIVPADRHRGPLDWHGTFIAGIIGASANNSVDIAGVGYGSRVMPIIAADGNGAITEADAAAAITHATARGAKVINLSFAIPASTPSATLKRAVEAAGRAGAVLVAAMGNNASRTTVYPAAFAKDHSYVIAVGATNVLDARSACSNTHSYITVGAPGENITSLRPGNGTMVAPCATSAATAFVSGIASLIAARSPGISPSTIKSLIAGSADDIEAKGRDELTGSGRVNAERAVWGAAAGPRVALARPAAAGSSNRTTLSATLTSPATVVAAEYWIDSIGSVGKGKKLSASDGRWGGEKVEGARLTISTSSLSEGAHTVWVRGRDVYNRWGPAATAVLVVDRTAPTIPTLKIDPAVVVPGDPRTKLHIAVADVLSRTVRMTITFIDATGASQAEFVYALPSGSYVADWRGTIDRPGATSFNGRALPPGPYTVRAVARDESGRTTTAETQCAVTADART